jgi:hypothetical protein
VVAPVEVFLPPSTLVDAPTTLVLLVLGMPLPVLVVAADFISSVDVASDAMIESNFSSDMFTEVDKIE